MRTPHSAAEPSATAAQSASGAVGRYVLRRVSALTERQPVLALSRGDPPAWALPWAAVVQWHRGGLAETDLAGLADVHSIISAGPHNPVERRFAQRTATAAGCAWLGSGVSARGP